ncbi:MAG: hypothetical protein ABIE94_00695 [archaeon]
MIQEEAIGQVALAQEGIEHEARKEFETTGQFEGYRSPLTEAIISGSTHIEEFLKDAPEMPQLYGGDYKTDVEEAKKTIEDARRALAEGTTITRSVQRQSGLGRLVQNAGSTLKNIFSPTVEEVVEKIEDSLYDTLDQNVMGMEKAITKAGPAISKGQQIIEKIKDYKAGLRRDYHRLMPVARDLGDYVIKLDKEIANLEYDLEHFQEGPGEKMALEEALAELCSSREKAQNDEAMVYERILSLTNRNKMAREDQEQNSYLVNSLKRFVSSGKNFVEEAKHKKAFESMPEYGALSVEINDAIKALSSCLHNIREKEQSLVKATAEIMRREGIPTDVYSSDDLVSARETSTYVKKALEDQNRTSVSRGLDAISRM